MRARTWLCDFRRQMLTRREIQIMGDKGLAAGELDRRARHILNAGSVGQPRDNDPRASFLTYDSDSRVVRWQRVEYAIDKAQERIVRSGVFLF